MSQKKPADFGDLSRNVLYCQCTGDCKAVMCVGCLPNTGELFVGAVNASSWTVNDKHKKMKRSVDFYQLTQKWQKQLHRAVTLVQSYDLTSRGWALARR